MKLPRKIVILFVIVVGIIALTQIDFSDDHQPENKKKSPSKSLAHTITHTDRLGSFSVALKTSDMIDSLKSKDNFTVFAPSDSAFTDLPKGKFKDLMNDSHAGELRSLVEHHILRTTRPDRELKSGRLATLAGDSLMITHKNDTTFVNGAPIREKSIMASNGIIYVIDRVLMPDAQN